AVAPPGVEGLGLVGKWRPAGAQRPRGRLPGAGLVLVGDPLLPQVFDQGAIPAGLRAGAAGAWGSPAARQGGQEFGSGPGDDQGAAVKRQADGSWFHAGHYGRSPAVCPWRTRTRGGRKAAVRFLLT